MSYSIQEATLERQHDISQAREGVDAPRKLRRMANIIEKEGNESLAHALRMEAIRLDDSFDEWRDNQ